MEELVIFDLETTGTDVKTAKIVQFAAKNITTGKVMNVLVNPGCPIPADATAVHGISDADVADAKKFDFYALTIKKSLEGKIIGGFNSNRFDIPLLINEMKRCNVTLNISDNKLLDVMVLYRKLYPNTLAAIYERFTGTPLSGAHDAEIDIDGTAVVLDYMINNHEGIKGLDYSKLEDFYNDGKKRLDLGGMLSRDDEGYLVYAWGKHNGHRVLESFDTRNYARWVLGKDFPSDLKNLLEDELKINENKIPPGEALTDSGRRIFKPNANKSYER